MQITTRNIALTVDDSIMRVYVAAPAAKAAEPIQQYPGIVFYSDIYQLGRPITRWADRLAGYGFVVAAPEIFHRLEPVGTVIEPNDLGRMRGNANAGQTAIAAYDADAQALLAWLQAEASVASGQLGTFGFCIGGHLALRAALQTPVNASVCCYPTGLQNGKLGQGIADTLERVSELSGETLLVFGSRDRHVPPADRQKIATAFEQANVQHRILTYDAQHTFMRDDGYRYDPVVADTAWAEITAFLGRVFGG